MAKFKIGDVIVNAEGNSTYERTVVGYASDGQVVYEYKHNEQLGIGHHKEGGFKLKPTKKEGWINIYGVAGSSSARPYGGDVYATKEEALRNNKGMLATIKIEWEE